MNVVERAVTAISAQQPKEKNAVWMVGEQLKDICRAEPACAELLLQDMEVPELALVKAEKQIKAYADKHKTGWSACVTPIAADRILRKFYGLPKKPDASVMEEKSEKFTRDDAMKMKAKPKKGIFLDLEEFL